jgi:hypothetical protein
MVFKINLIVVSRKSMKRIAYIPFISLVLLVVSCQKEVIRKECGNESQEIRMLRTGDVVDLGEGNTDEETSGGDITDPNSDKDESVRRKRR